MDRSAELTELVRQIHAYRAAKQRAQRTLDYEGVLQWMELRPRLIQFIAATNDETACQLFIEAFRDSKFIADFLDQLVAETSTYLAMYRGTFEWSAESTRAEIKQALAAQADGIYAMAYELCKHLDQYIALYEVYHIPAPLQHKAESLMRYVDTLLKLGPASSTERRFIFRLLQDAEAAWGRQAAVPTAATVPVPGGRQLAQQLLQTLVHTTGLSLEAGPGFGL
jgi:hypothetical protein